ncbi:MAG: glycosyltransferase [Mycoplasmatales bacterium]
MAIYILTTSIFGGSGLDKSVTQTANLLTEHNENVMIVTFSKLKNSNKFAKPQKFPLNKNIKTLNINSINVDYHHKIEKSFKNVVTINHQFYKIKINEFDIEKIKKFNNTITKEDFIIFATPIISRIFNEANIKPNTKTMLQIHSNYEEDLANQNELLKSLNIIDFLQPVSYEMVKFLQKITKFESNKIIPIYNILKIKEEYPEIEDNKLIKRISIIGSIQERKNQLEALKAINELKNYDIKLCIWGIATNKEYYEKIIEYIKINNLSTKVEFCGFGNEEEIFNSSDIIIATSTNEGFNYTLLEGLYWGKPLVSYNFLYGPNEMIEDDYNGYLVEVGDYKSLSKKLELLITNSSLYNTFGKNSQKKFKENFESQKIFLQYKNIIKNNGEKVKETDYYTQKNTVFGKLPKINQKRKKYLLVDKCEFSYQLNLEKNYIQNYTKLKAYYITKKISKDIPFILENGVIKFNINLYYQNKRRIVFYLEDDNENQYYLFRITKKSNLEINFFEKNLNIINQEIIINNIGMSIISGNNQIQKIESLTGENLDFTDSSVRYNEQVIVPGIQLNKVREKLKITYINHQVQKYNITVQQVSYDYVITALKNLEEKYDLYNLTIDNIYIWEIIRPNIEILFAKKLTIFKEEKMEQKVDINLKNLQTKNLQGKNNKVLINYSTNDKLEYFFENKELDIVCSSLELYAKIQDNSRVYYEEVEETVKIKETDTVNNLDLILKELVDDYWGTEILGRLAKFKREYLHWNKVFKKYHYNEVLIVSSIWNPGIIKAAKDNNIKTAEVQYALATKNHLNYGLDYKKRHYYTDKMYIWDKLWKIDNKFSPKLETYYAYKYLDSLKKVKEDIDIVIIGQHLITEKIIEYLIINKIGVGKKVVYCAHPKEKTNLKNLPVNFSIVYGDTLQYVMRAKEVIGVFSTTLYEANYLGKKVKILKIPSYEIIIDKKSQGRFEFI